jgi:hypothetical protein
LILYFFIQPFIEICLFTQAVKHNADQCVAGSVAVECRQDNILEVRHQETGELVGRYGTDEDGKAFFYGPQTEVCFSYILAHNTSCAIHSFASG